MKVFVVGAGIIGAATAYHLSRLGARVTVVDASTEPRGASAATFGWINANGKQPEHYFELNRDGMAAHADLARQLVDDSWLHAGGSLEWTGAHGADALRARVAEHAARGYPAELIPAARLRELEPEIYIVVQGAKWEVAVYPSEGWVDTLALVERLLSAAHASGAVVRRRARVTALDAGRDGRATVTLGHGETAIADVVVNCAGPDGGAIAAMAGLAVETAGAPGLNAVTVPDAVRLRRVVRAPGVHFRPETGGRLLIASPSADTALANGADVSELAARNVTAASRWLLVAADTPIEEVRVARRAMPPDGLPMVGRTADVPWLYHVIGHSGVTLAPLLGRLAADEIVGGEENERLTPYRPDRFASSLSS